MKDYVELIKINSIVGEPGNKIHQKRGILSKFLPRFSFL